METVTSTGNKLSQEVAAVHAALKQLGGQAEAAVPSLQGMFEQQQQLLVSYTEVSRPVGLVTGATCCGTSNSGSLFSGPLNACRAGQQHCEGQ